MDEIEPMIYTNITEKNWRTLAVLTKIWKKKSKDLRKL